MARRGMKRRRKQAGLPSTGILAADATQPLRICGASEPLELLAADGEAEDEPQRLRKFSMVAYTGGAMTIAGYYYPVVADLDGMRLSSQTRPILQGHDPDRIVGHSTAIDKTAQRLRVSGVISGIGEDAAQVVALATNGFPWQASIGASVEKMEFVEAGQKAKANGRLFDGPVYVARATTLREISFVPMGADQNSSASVAASHSGVTTMTFEQWLAAKGFDAATLNDTQKATLRAAFDAEARPTPPAPAPAPARAESMETILAHAREENDRRQRITELVARAITDNPGFVDTAERIGRLAIEGKWDVQKAELEILRASRPTGTFVVQSKPDVTSEVLEAAICKAGGLKTLEKSFKPEVLEAADRRFRHGISLGEFVGLTARANGWRGDSIRADLGGALRAAFTPRVDVRATVGPSTLDISGILGATANKFLREGFMSVEDSWRKVTSIRSVTDFKTITSYSMTGDNTYEKVAPGGEIKHGTLGEQSYTNQADTYGKMLGLDRRDLINDDLGALTGVSRRLGRGGALKLNDVFWTEFLADASTFFTTARTNYDDGASDTLMDLTGIANAHTLFMNQTDPDSKPLGVIPKIILVPPALWPSAWTLLMSTTLNLATSSAASTGTSSPWTGMFELVKSTYLSNSSYTGYSAAAWYMLADPQDLSMIETCFLNGVEMPTVETADLDFNRLGIALRGYHDFGVNKQEYRAAVKMKGEA